MKKDKLSSIATDRLKKIMLCDRLTLDSDAIGMLRADIARVLSSYFEYSQDNLKLDVYLSENTQYRLDVSLNADGILPIKSIK